MPAELERKLKAVAKLRGYGKKRTGAYVFGNPVMQTYMKKKRHMMKS